MYSDLFFCCERWVNISNIMHNTKENGTIEHWSIMNKLHIYNFQIFLLQISNINIITVYSITWWLGYCFNLKQNCLVFFWNRNLFVVIIDRYLYTKQSESLYVEVDCKAVKNPVHTNCTFLNQSRPCFPLRQISRQLKFMDSKNVIL